TEFASTRRRKRPRPTMPMISAATAQDGNSQRSTSSSSASRRLIEITKPQSSTGLAQTLCESSCKCNHYATPAVAELTAPTSAPGSFPPEDEPAKGAAFLQCDSLLLHRR